MLLIPIISPAYPIEVEHSYIFTGIVWKSLGHFFKSRVWGVWSVRWLYFLAHSGENSRIIEMQQTSLQRNIPRSITESKFLSYMSRNSSLKGGGTYKSAASQEIRMIFSQNNTKK